MDTELQSECGLMILEIFKNGKIGDKSHLESYPIFIVPIRSTNGLETERLQILKPFFFVIYFGLIFEEGNGVEIV